MPDLPVINASVDVSSDIHETSIEKYKKNEFWGIWNMPISPKVHGFSINAPERRDTYNIENIQDYNLNTICAFQYNKSEQPYFEYKFDFPRNTGYAGVYQFTGVCNVFNGNCKSESIWNNYARIKTMLIYYNDKPICYVKLLDTWHFQRFDISKLFTNKRSKTNMNAAYEIKNGDRLKFEITGIYPGSKYNNIAISEFLCEGGDN